MSQPAASGASREVDLRPQPTAPGLTAPDLNSWVSPAARRVFDFEVRGRGQAFATIAEARAHYDLDNQRRLAVMRELYPAQSRRSQIAGVPVDVVVPDPREPDLVAGEPVLICLHGGGFAWGAGAGALLEAVPVAAVSGLPVVAIDYRMAPEHRHPAAAEDVVAVYRALITDHPTGRIGLYGCSAGGALVAQSLMQFQALDLPTPGAAAMLHAAGLELGGDLLALAPVLNGDEPSAGVTSLAALPYFEGADPADPAVFPGGHPAVLARFPPSLVVTSTRDFAGSSASVMHRRLLAQGVDAEFILFDGLWHAFHMWGELPESAELFARLSEFFARRLR